MCNGVNAKRDPRIGPLVIPFAVETRSSTGSVGGRLGRCLSRGRPVVGNN